MNNSWLTVVQIWTGIGVLAFPWLLHQTAPYGRHTSTKFGPLMSNRWGWMIMELPVLIIFTALFLNGSAEKSASTWVIFGLFALHYTYRSLIYPWRTRTKGKVIPVLVVLAAILFNCFNGTLNGWWLGHTKTYPLEWLWDSRFLGGLTMFVIGMLINFTSDEALFKLRKPGEAGYKIPYGGLFAYISCPNLLGEIILWWGFACLCWNPAALSFAVWTTVNLVPRAKDHHRWYQRTFTDYPSRRRILIPGLW